MGFSVRCRISIECDIEFPFLYSELLYSAASSFYIVWHRFVRAVLSTMDFLWPEAKQVLFSISLSSPPLCSTSFHPAYGCTTTQLTATACKRWESLCGARIARILQLFFASFSC